MRSSNIKHVDVYKISQLPMSNCKSHAHLPALGRRYIQWRKPARHPGTGPFKRFIQSVLKTLLGTIIVPASSTGSHLHRLSLSLNEIDCMAIQIWLTNTPCSKSAVLGSSMFLICMSSGRVWLTQWDCNKTVSADRPSLMEECGSHRSVRFRMGSNTGFTVIRSRWWAGNATENTWNCWVCKSRHFIRPVS